MNSKKSSLEKKINNIIVGTAGAIAVAAILLQGSLNLYTEHRYTKYLQSKYQQTTTLPKQYYVVTHKEGDLVHKIVDYNKDGIFDEVWIYQGPNSIRFKRRDFGGKHLQKYQKIFDSGKKMRVSRK